MDARVISAFMRVFRRAMPAHDWPLNTRPRFRGDDRNQCERERPSLPGSRPGARGLRLLLEAFDLVLLDHGEPDIVEPVEQAMLAVRIDVELHHTTVGAPDLLLRKINRQRRIGAALGIVE